MARNDDALAGSVKRLACRVPADGGLGELVDQFVEGAGDAVEEFVHQFGFLHLGDVDDDFLAGAGHPAGLGVGAAAAGEDEHAGVGPVQGFQVGGELAFGLGVV